MKIQGLAVIAIIIILPISIILNAYSRNQIKTLDLQIQYDSKLQNATYDAIKAFQLNMSNSSTSDLANSKMRDINASVNTFYNSLSSHFNMQGYGKDVLQNYVPAVVYTMYDGYYIYSAYDNVLDEKDNFADNATYKNGENIYGLKPYIYYSCRYKRDNQFDIVITYSLDSYITIQGVINQEPVNESGYLLSGLEKKGDKIYYRGIEITKEGSLQQQVYVEGDTTGKGANAIIIDNTQVGSIKECSYRKVNGVKYYLDDNNEVFAIINDKKYKQNIEPEKITSNDNAIRYYEDALEFREKFENGILAGIKNLEVSDAVDINGQKYTENNNPYYNYGQIFNQLFIVDKYSSRYIEDSDSNFNAHKMQVIKNSIESNLMVAIENYNKVSSSQVNFQMPKLQDSEWEQIANNISMISFLQGLNIGGKIYNGYSVVSNNNNEDYVSEKSIYMLDFSTANKTYYKVTDSEIRDTNKYDKVNFRGVLNTDFQRRMATVSNGNNKLSKTIYFYPNKAMASYSSIINPNIINEMDIKTYSYYNQYDAEYYIAQKYYTALGRERYGMYRVANKLEEVQELLLRQGY